jgi:hypothetical protein
MSLSPLQAAPAYLPKSRSFWVKRKQLPLPAPSMLPKTVKLSHRFWTLSKPA